MNDENFLAWVTQASPWQFFLGVVLLVFGSRQILSEKNLSSSLGGLLLPVKFLRKKREQAAEEEANEMELLRDDNARMAGELTKRHRWAVSVTTWIRRLELWAAEEGHELPKPPFIHWIDFEEDKEDDER